MKRDLGERSDVIFVQEPLMFRVAVLRLVMPGRAPSYTNTLPSSAPSQCEMPRKPSEILLALD